MENPYERTDDPEKQCSYPGCKIVKYEGADNCINHGGTCQARANQKRSYRRYQLGKWQARVDAMSDDPEIKNLRDEIGILRMMLETRLQTCHNEIDLITNAPILADLVSRVERTVVAANKLEDHLGKHMDQAQLLVFAEKVIEVVSAEIEDSEILDRIANGILKAVGDTAGE